MAEWGKAGLMRMSRARLARYMDRVEPEWVHVIVVSKAVWAERKRGSLVQWCWACGDVILVLHEQY